MSTPYWRIPFLSEDVNSLAMSKTLGPKEARALARLHRSFWSASLNADLGQRVAGTAAHHLVLVLEQAQESGNGLLVRDPAESLHGILADRGVRALEKRDEPVSGHVLARHAEADQGDALELLVSAPGKLLHHVHRDQISHGRDPCQALGRGAPDLGLLVVQQLDEGPQRALRVERAEPLDHGEPQGRVRLGLEHGKKLGHGIEHVGLAGHHGGLGPVLGIALLVL
jgi:hypothetical protein